MSRSLSSVIREYEQLRGGRLPEVRRWHNFLLRGGAITTCQINIKGQDVKFDVDSMFIKRIKRGMVPQRNDAKLVLGWLTGDQYSSCVSFIKAIIKSVSFFTQEYNDKIGIIRNEDPLHLGDVQYFAVAYKDMNTWIPFIIKNIRVFYFNDMNLVNRNVRNIEIFRSILGHFPCHTSTIKLYMILTDRARYIIDTRLKPKNHIKLKNKISPYLKSVNEMITNLINPPQELLDLHDALSEIHTYEPPNEALPNTQTSSSSFKRKNDAPHPYDEMESNTTTTTTTDTPQPKRTKKTKPPQDQDIVDLT